MPSYALHATLGGGANQFRRPGKGVFHKLRAGHRALVYSLAQIFISTKQRSATVNHSLRAAYIRAKLEHALKGRSFIHSTFSWMCRSAKNAKGFFFLSRHPAAGLNEPGLQE